MEGSLIFYYLCIFYETEQLKIATWIVSSNPAFKELNGGKYSSEEELKISFQVNFYLKKASTL